MAQRRRAQETLEPWTRELARWNREHCGVDELEQAYSQLAQLPSTFSNFHRSYDVILSPVLRSPPLPIGELAPDRTFDELMPALFDWMSYTPLQNLAGTPGISLPLFSTPEGLPVARSSSLTADRRKCCCSSPSNWKQPLPGMTVGRRTRSPPRLLRTDPRNTKWDTQETRSTLHARRTT